MSKFFDDVLRSADSHMAFDITKDRVDPFKTLSVTAKAAPKKKVTVDHNMTKQSEWKGDAEVESQKTSTKVGINHGDCRTTWTFANDKFVVAADSQAYKEDGWSVRLGGSFENKPAKKEWKVEGNTKVSTPDLGGAHLFFNASAETNQKSETTIKPKLNVQVDDISVGVSAEHDTKDLKKAWGQFVLKQDDSQFWLRVDKAKSWAGLGCAHHKGTYNHAYEGRYSWDKSFKGFRGQPVTVHWGTNYKLSDSTSISINGDVAENTTVGSNATHKVDDHWTVGVNQEFDSAKMADKGRSPYAIGFNVTYKL